MRTAICDDEIGKVYTYLTVIRLHSLAARGRRVWECMCKCGKIITAQTKCLRSGNTRSCGCIRAKDESGNRYGKWTVIKSAGKSSSGAAAWECKCDCGTVKTVAGAELRKGRSTSCGCTQWHRLPIGQANKNALLSSYKHGASSRGLSFDLTPDRFFELTQGRCHYCNADLMSCCSFPGTRGEYRYNGIDRLDSSIGYTNENCVTSCYLCNRAKMAMSRGEFLDWVKRVYSHQFLKENTNYESRQISDI